MKVEEREKLYTLRWYLREKLTGDANDKGAALGILGDLLGDGAQPEADISPSEPGRKLLWIPFAQTTGFPKSRTQGHYRTGYPKGAIVHFTAGWRNGLNEGLEAQARDGYSYLLIDKDGNIGQNFALDSWGWHAGPSSWKGLDGTVSDELVGIEIQAGGSLDKDGKTWFGKTPDATRRIAKKTANQQAGVYESYTQAQEEALIRLLRWLHSNNPEVFKFEFVLGHDEVSPGRKNDPGGALSMTMPDLRKLLMG